MCSVTVPPPGRSGADPAPGPAAAGSGAAAAGAIGDGTMVGDRYRLVRRLGSGGMGVVWEAADGDDGDRAVALKHVRLDEPDPDERARMAEALRREWRVAAAAGDHRGVVGVRGLVEHADGPWLVMDLVPGRDLRAVVRDDGPLPARRAARLGVGMAEALEHLHRCGLVHGDVAPGNVMITDDRVVLTDFGISRPLRTSTVTATRRARGAPGFVPPEVVAGSLPTPGADVFGLGAVLLFAVSGQGPWGDGDERVVFGRALAGAPVVTARGRLRRVLRAMLRRRPRERPTPGACRAALEKVAEGGGPRFWWSLLSHRRLIAVVVAGIVVAVVAAAAAAWSIEHRDARIQARLGALGTDVGAQRSLDPCGLLDPDRLRRFGPASLVPDYGDFDRCDVFVDRAGTSVQLTALAESGDRRPPTGTPTSESGGLVALAVPPTPTGCERVVEAPGGWDVDLYASIDAGSDPALCAMADDAVDTTVAALAGGDYPTHSEEFPAASLARLDACALLPADALPGGAGGAWSVHPGFGRWDCRWRAPGRPRLQVHFDRDDQGAAGLGRPAGTIAGRPTAEQSEGPGECTVAVQQRPYPRPEGSTGYESVYVELDDVGAPDPCGLTRAVAAAVASRLPTPH
jgi:eukaryotic-like serine/threonine-protein kinase